MIPDEAIDRMRDLTAGAWRLYCYLLRCRNRQTGQCNPSAATCAKAIGVNPDHIFRLRRELAKKKWVTFDQGTATIVLDLDSVENDTPVINDTLSKMTPPSVINDTEPLSKMTPPSVINAPTCKEEPEERTRGKNQRVALTRRARKKTNPLVVPPPKKINLNLWRNQKA